MYHKKKYGVPRSVVGRRHARSRMFFHKGSNFDLFFFLVDKGGEHPNTAINGVSLAYR